MSEPQVAPTVEMRTDCLLCWFFKRPPRSKAVKMVVLRLFPQAKGLEICRDCLRNLSSMLKRSTKK